MALADAGSLVESASWPPFRIKLGSVLPDFACETTQGRFELHEFLSRPPAWTILFSYAKERSPVSASELRRCHELLPRFKALGIKIVGLSGSSLEEHQEWAGDLLAADGMMGESLGFPVIADPDRRMAEHLGILDPSELDEEGRPMPANAVFVIGPNKTNRLCMLYPARAARDFLEVARVVQSLFLTQDFILATPANWREGDRVIVAPVLPHAAARQKFKNFEIQELPSGKQYLCFVDCPDLGQPFLFPDAVSPPDVLYCPGPSDFRIKLGAEMPDFHCVTTQGNFSFHDFLGREPRWTILVSHPNDFTPVCTTEMAACQGFLCGSLAERGVKLIGLSCNSVDSHVAWSTDILAYAGAEGDALHFPLISDEDRSIATKLGMLDPLEKDREGQPMPARALFLIDPDGRNRFTIIYPASTGRHFGELLRVVDSVLLAERSCLSTAAA